MVRSQYMCKNARRKLRNDSFVYPNALLFFTLSKLDENVYLKGRVSRQ